MLNIIERIIFKYFRHLFPESDNHRLMQSNYFTIFLIIIRTNIELMTKFFLAQIL